jgi:hypothetical protein
MSIELALALTAAVAVVEFGLLCYCLVDCYWPEQEDYIELADLLGASYAHVEQMEANVGKEALYLIQTGIEDICKQDNPRFDRDRFQEAINKARLTKEDQ